jgi:hypothetical protein
MVTWVLVQLCGPAGATLAELAAPAPAGVVAAADGLPVSPARTGVGLDVVGLVPADPGRPDVLEDPQAVSSTTVAAPAASRAIRGVGIDGSRSQQARAARAGAGPVSHHAGAEWHG